MVRQIQTILFEHAVDDSVATAFEPQGPVTFVNKSQPLHLAQGPAIIRLDLGGQSFDLGKQRHEDRPEDPA
jgi:hypothetical protein